MNTYVSYIFYVHAWMLSHFSCVWLFVTLWTVASQAPLSMGFSKQEYWSGLPCPPPGDLPDPGIEPVFHAASASQGDSLLLSHLGSPYIFYMHIIMNYIYNIILLYLHIAYRKYMKTSWNTQMKVLEWKL